jgi:two-component system, sensor histidine kinase PdtaS
MNVRFRLLMAVCCLGFPVCPSYAQEPDAVAYKKKAAFAYTRFQLDSAEGNWLAAVNSLEKFRQFTDSAAYIQHQEQLNQIENAHDMQKKNRDVAFNAEHISLLNRQTALQNEALKNEKTIRSLLLGGVAMLLLLLVISYNRYKLKARTNNTLQGRQREISGQNNALKQLVAEREWLLKEIHNRVKNNLELVISLLNSQVVDIKNESAAMLIRDSRNRMNAISIIHHRLFKDDDVSGVDMAGYLKELTRFLGDSFGNTGKIDFVVSLEPLNLNVSQAIPVGLIVNEAITNAFKYAFPSRQTGAINLRLKTSADGIVMLTIGDNGVGLREGFDITTSNTLGVSLMQGLAGQIKGKLKFINFNGLLLDLTFKKLDY